MWTGDDAVRSLGDYFLRRQNDSIVPPSAGLTAREKYAQVVAEHPAAAGFLAYCASKGFDDQSIKEHLVKVASSDPGIARDLDHFFSKAALMGGGIAPASMAKPIQAPRPPQGMLATGKDMLGRGMNAVTGLAYGVGGTLATAGAGAVEGLGHVDRAMGGNHIDPNVWGDVRRNVWRGQNAGWEDVTRNLDPRRDIRWDDQTSVGRHNAANDQQLRAMGQDTAANVAGGAQWLGAATANAIPLAVGGGVAALPLTAKALGPAATASFLGGNLYSGFDNARTQSQARMLQQQSHIADQQRIAGGQAGVYEDGQGGRYVYPLQGQSNQPQQPEPQAPAGEGTVLREPGQPAASQPHAPPLPEHVTPDVVSQLSPEQAQQYHQFAEQQSQDITAKWQNASPAQRQAMAPQIESAYKAKVMAWAHDTGQDPREMLQKGLEGGWTADDLQRTMQTNPTFAKWAEQFGDPMKAFGALGPNQKIAVGLGLGMGLVGIASSLFGDGGLLGLLMGILGIGSAAAGAGMFGPQGPLGGLGGQISSLFGGGPSASSPAGGQPQPPPQGAPAGGVSPPPPAGNSGLSQQVDFLLGLPPEQQRRAMALMPPEQRQQLEAGARDLKAARDPQTWAGWANTSGLADTFGMGEQSRLASEAQKLGIPPEQLRRLLEARISQGI